MSGRPLRGERQGRGQLDGSEKKAPGSHRGRAVLRRTTPCASSHFAIQPSTFTLTVVAFWAFGAFTVSRPP